MNQQGLLADKKSEGRCSVDYFFFTVYVKHFSGFIEALGSKGILCTLKKGITKKKVLVSLFRQTYRSFICKFASISCGIRQFR